MKKCSKCGQEKDLTLFYNKKSSKDGLDAMCKACVNERNKQYAQENKDKVNQIKQAYKERNRETYLEKERIRARERYADNPEFFRERAKTEKYQATKKAYNERNKEKRSKWWKDHYEKNRDTYLKRTRDWYYDNPEKVKEYATKYRKENYDKYSASRYAYWKRYPEKKKAVQAINNAIAQGKLYRPDTCENCGKKCKPEGHHFDYSKPLEVTWVCKKCHTAIHRNFD